jgi:hypothetical protein
MKRGSGVSWFRNIGGKGLEVVQCAPQHQLLVVEMCCEEEFTT